MSKLIINTDPFTSNYRGLQAVVAFIDQSGVDKNSGVGYRSRKIVEINDGEELLVIETEPDLSPIDAIMWDSEFTVSTA